MDTLDDVSPRRRPGRPANPAGLVELVGKILSNRQGHDQALTLGEIAYFVHESPLFRSVSGRHVRSAIEALREQGWLICTALDGDGYFVAGSIDEYREFRQSYISYATTILTRVRQMDEVAQQRFKSSARQEKLL
jgi:hypothetical protein